MDRVTSFLSKKDRLDKKENPPVKFTYRTLFWLFLFGSVIGFILEGLWCILR